MRRAPVPANLKVSIEGPNAAVLTWGETSLTVPLVSSSRARRVKATLTGTVVAVRHPSRITKRRLADSIYALSGWIMAAQAESERRSQVRSDVVLLNGQELPVQFAEGRPAVSVDSQGVLVRSMDGTGVELLRRWLRQRALETLPPLVEKWSVLMGLDYARVRIAAQTRRWGSCSSRGTISLNWRLIMAPPEVQEYLVIHELAHIREMNHSAKYWAVVAEHCPNYKIQEQWLKEHGWRLIERL